LSYSDIWKFSISGSLKADLLRHERVKFSYMCSWRFCTVDTLRLQTFCCGMCGRYFKWNSSVVQHFKRYSVSLRFSDV